MARWEAEQKAKTAAAAVPADDWEAKMRAKMAARAAEQNASAGIVESEPAAAAGDGDGDGAAAAGPVAPPKISLPKIELEGLAGADPLAQLDAFLEVGGS